MRVVFLAQSQRGSCASILAQAVVGVSQNQERKEHTCGLGNTCLANLLPKNMLGMQ